MKKKKNVTIHNTKKVIQVQMEFILYTKEGNNDDHTRVQTPKQHTFMIVAIQHIVTASSFMNYENDNV